MKSLVKSQCNPIKIVSKILSKILCKIVFKILSKILGKNHSKILCFSNHLGVAPYISIDFQYKIFWENQKYFETSILRVFCEPEMGVSLQHANHAGHISIDFQRKIYWENQKYFEHAMQFNFQLILSSKFPGKIESKLKLALLHMFCQPELGGPPPACKTYRSHFI